MFNLFHIFGVANKELKKSLIKNTYFYEDLDYIDYLKNFRQEELYKYIEKIIIDNKINCMFVTMGNMDCSINLEFLNKLKKTYKIKIVFLFENAELSFEYIDRYYAQLSEMIILYDIEYIKDFYEMLEIKYFILKGKISKNIINKKNIFSSALNELRGNINFENKDIDKGMDNYIKEFLIFLKDTPLLENINLLRDKKNCYAEDIYRIYWILFHFKKKKELSIFLRLFTFRNIKYINNMTKLFFILYKEKNIGVKNPINIINKALYKEYTI